MHRRRDHVKVEPGLGSEDDNSTVEFEDDETVPVQPTGSVRTRSCSIPLVRLQAGTSDDGLLVDEKISKLECRVEQLEGHCRLLRRRVRALEMERTEDIQRTVLELLHNQKFTISTSFQGEDCNPGSGKKSSPHNPAVTKKGPADVIQYSSSDEEAKIEINKTKIKNQQKHKSSSNNCMSGVTPQAQVNAKRRLIVKHVPLPLSNINNSRATSARASHTTSKQVSTAVENTGDESEDPEEVSESFENNDSEVIAEGDVAVILEHYDDEDYVEDVEQTKTIYTRPKSRKRRLNTLHINSKKRRTDVLNKIRREKIYLANKTHTCSVCDKSFRSNWELQRHSLVHSRDQCFKCPLCPDKNYTQKHSVTRHLQRFHLMKEYVEENEEGVEEVEVLK